MGELNCLVLVVEDEPQMRRFIRASLTSHNYKIIECPKSSEVAMLTISHNPSLILLDLGLPDGDGIDVTKQLRQWC